MRFRKRILKFIMLLSVDGQGRFRRVAHSYLPQLPKILNRHQVIRVHHSLCYFDSLLNTWYCEKRHTSSTYDFFASSLRSSIWATETFYECEPRKIWETAGFLRNISREGKRCDNKVASWNLSLLSFWLNFRFIFTKFLTQSAQNI